MNNKHSSSFPILYISTAEAVDGNINSDVNSY